VNLGSFQGAAYVEDSTISRTSVMVKSESAHETIVTDNNLTAGSSFGAMSGLIWKTMMAH
jgi:hypothetical protein